MIYEYWFILLTFTYCCHKEISLFVSSHYEGQGAANWVLLTDLFIHQSLYVELTFSRSFFPPFFPALLSRHFFPPFSPPSCLGHVCCRTCFFLSVVLRDLFKMSMSMIDLICFFVRLIFVSESFYFFIFPIIDWCSSRINGKYLIIWSHTQNKQKCNIYTSFFFHLCKHLLSQIIMHV